MSALWPGDGSPFEEAFDPSATRNPCTRVLFFGPNGLTEERGNSPAYTLAEWERLKRERPEMFVVPPDPENRAGTIIVRLVVPDEDHCSRNESTMNTRRTPHDYWIPDRPPRSPERAHHEAAGSCPTSTGAV